MEKSSPIARSSGFLPKIVGFGALVVIALTMLYPLLWMLGTAVKTNDPAEILREGAGSSIFPDSRNILRNLFPPVWHWENFPEVFRASPFARYYFNSALIALTVTAGQILTSSMA